MRLKITKTNSSTNYYIIKDVKNNGKRTTVIHERLGTEKEILERSNGKDISVWIKKYLNDLNSKSEGYIPSYKRTDLTDLLHDTFDFRTDYEIIENKNIEKILKKLKK